MMTQSKLNRLKIARGTPAREARAVRKPMTSAITAQRLLSLAPLFFTEQSEPGFDAKIAITVGTTCERRATVDRRVTNE
jgi:hypothetical protein